MDHYKNDPVTWSVKDLTRPSDDCDMPEPIRGDRPGYWHTCPHCNIRFILVTTFDGSFWVNASQHKQMIDAHDRYRHHQYGGNRYGMYQQYHVDNDYDYPHLDLNVAKAKRWLTTDALVVDLPSYTETTDEEKDTDRE